MSAEGKKIHLEPGSYGPESLKEIQKIFDGAWRDVEKSVFPWDVHATRERLAILVFQHVSNSDGDVEHIKITITNGTAVARGDPHNRQRSAIIIYESPNHDFPEF
jgi:hypothetical protein